MERRVFDLEYKGEKNNFEDYYFNRYLRKYIAWLESETKIQVSALGTGVKNGERILKRRLVKDIENYN